MSTASTPSPRSPAPTLNSKTRSSWSAATSTVLDLRNWSHRQRRRLSCRHGGRPHPQSSRRQAPPHYPHCSLVRRGRGPLRLPRLRTKQHFGEFPEAFQRRPRRPVTPAFQRAPGGPLKATKEWETLDAYYNLDNGTGMPFAASTPRATSPSPPIFRQWIAPLEDLGVTTITNRNTGGTDHLSFRRPRTPRLPVHPGRDGLRDPHPPLRHGYSRPLAPSRPIGSRRRRSHLPLQHLRARRHDAPQTLSPS